MENDNFSQRFQEAAEESLKSIMDYLRSDSSDENLLKKARVASSILASHQRHESTASAREKTVINLARSLAKDREELSRYVSITMPESSISKALPKPESE